MAVVRGAAVLCILALQAGAAAPDWLRAAARETLPSYADSPQAVMLRHEQTTTVKSNGEISTVHRAAYRILRPEGRRYGVVQVYFDGETRVTSLKGWSISASRGEYEVTEKDAADAILFGDNLYEDARQKVLRIPAAEVGAVIGYEYEQRRRPFIRQDLWSVQREVPVRAARFEVRLPAGWEYRASWSNHPGLDPQRRGPNQWVWELNDLPPIKRERSMPDPQATVARLGVTYTSPDGAGSLRSWNEIGRWYGQLAADRRQLTPEMRQKVGELTSRSATAIGKIQALASFVQQDVRYVAIEIGIGGYQPHPAPDIFRNRYGDCKDKATLLSSMLSEIGVESYYVLVNTHRGVVRPELASALVFNHVILAIRVPPEAQAEGLLSTVQHPDLGSLLLFDPTDPYVRTGYLPTELQTSYGLLIGRSGGEPLKLPLLPAQVNSMQRSAKLDLDADGTLQGEAQEIRKGAPASDLRSAWQNSSESDRRKALQGLLGQRTIVAELKDLRMKELDGEPVVDYSFRLARYASSTGGLLLLRPCIFAEWGDDVLEAGDRSQPLEFPDARVQNEIIEITIPDGYVVDELPPAVQAEIGKISYNSKSETQGRILRYVRQLQIKDVSITKEELTGLRKFYRQMAADEKAKAVLKRQ